MPAPKYPPPLPGIIRITQSKLETYLKCGLRWQFEEETKNRVATVRMLIGSAVAAGAAVDNHEKIVRGNPATLNTIVDAAVADYEEECNASEISEPIFEVVKGKDDSAQAARTFGEEVSPQLSNVLSSEVPMLAVLRGIQLAGTPDVVTADGIGDLKVGQPWTQDRADRSRQLTLYSILLKVHSGKFPAKVWIDSMSFSRRRWHSQRLWSSRTPQSYSAVLSVVDAAHRGMEAGIALPAAEGSWWCGPRWCPFWSRCPAVSR